MHMESQSHLGTMIVAAAIAQGEVSASSGRDLLSAVIAGYEVGGRVGRAIVGEHFNESGHRPSGSFGPIASAAAVSRLLGLSEDQTSNALGMAASLGAGTNEFAAAGTMDLYFQNAFAARNGLVAAYLGRNNIQVAPQAIEGRAGMGRMLSGAAIDAQRIVARLNEDWEILNVYHKPAPACAYLQSAIQATQRLVKRRAVTAGEIERVTVHTFTLGKLCPGTDNPGPFRRIMDAQMSNQFVIAAVLLHGRVALEHIRDFQSPAIEQLAARIVVEIDERAVRSFPERKAGGIEVLFKNGERDREWVDDLAYPTPQFVDDKFDEYARAVLDRSSADRFRESVHSLEAVEDIRLLGTLLKTSKPRDAHRAGTRQSQDHAGGEKIGHGIAG
jgi:2-methylcitrate dehydratase PrpD